MRDLPVPRPRRVRAARPAAAAGADAAAARGPAAEALALPRRLPAGPDAVRGRRPRGRRAAALVGGGAAGRHAARGHAAASSSARAARACAACSTSSSTRRDGVEVVSPHGRSYIWTRKHAPVHVRGRVTRRAGGRWELDGDDGFVDESAGYHARHTAWRWSAGVGRDRRRPRVAWNLVDGVHDAPVGERAHRLGRRRAARGGAAGVRGGPRRASAGCASASGRARESQREPAA